MNLILKTARLDFALLKPYVKAICFVLLVPIFYTIFGRSLLSGIAFAMCVVSMSTSYTFAVSEKNNMDRLYGILPVTRKTLVLGKYLCVCVMGFLALLVSIVFHPLVLSALSVPVSTTEIFATGFLGAVIFILYISVQLPGYYKYGTIKGRMFMYIPLIGFLIISFLFTKSNLSESPILLSLFNNPLLLISLTVFLMLIILCLSVKISIGILEKKEF